MSFDLHKRVADLRKDLRHLCHERKRIEDQLVAVNLALNSLAREVNDEQERAEILQEIAAARRKPGLTERIAHSLRDMPYADLTATEVRKWLEREGTDLSGYSQPLATISITLTRMAKSGRVKVIRDGRKVAYRWNRD